MSKRRTLSVTPFRFDAAFLAPVPVTGTGAGALLAALALLPAPGRPTLGDLPRFDSVGDSEPPPGMALSGKLKVASLLAGLCPRRDWTSDCRSSRVWATGLPGSN